MGRQKIFVIVGSGSKVRRSKLVSQAAPAEEGHVRAGGCGKVLLPAGFDGRRLRQLVGILPRTVALEGFVKRRRAAETLARAGRDIVE